MTDKTTGRPFGHSPGSHSSTASPVPTPANDTTYPDDASKVSSNADLRVAEDDDLNDAAMSSTGLDIDNDHADERPFNRSQDAPDDEQDG